MAQAQTRKKRLTRGPRKGQVITVYAKSGTEVKGVVSKSGTTTNRSKKNPRAGQKYTTSIDKKGREVHTYANGKSVTIRGRRAKAVRFRKKGKGGFSVAARKAAVKAAPTKRRTTKRKKAKR